MNGTGLGNVAPTTDSDVVELLLNHYRKYTNKLVINDKRNSYITEANLFLIV